MSNPRDDEFKLGDKVCVIPTAFDSALEYNLTTTEPYEVTGVTSRMRNGITTVTSLSVRKIRGSTRYPIIEDIPPELFMHLKERLQSIPGR